MRIKLVFLTLGDSSPVGKFFDEKLPKNQKLYGPKRLRATTSLWIAVTWARTAIKATA